MALTRKLLKELGVESDVISQIIEAHTETVDGLKAQRDELREELTTALNKAKAELEELKSNANDSELQKKYDKLSEEYEAYKREVTDKETHSAKETALKELLSDIGIASDKVSKVIKYTNFDDVELDDKGKLKDASKLKKSVSEEWSEYIVKSGMSGANTANPPENKGGAKLTREEIYAKDDNGRYKLDAEQRQAAIAETFAQNSN